MDWKLELVVIPVSDVDRAKKFYAEDVGFAVDYDRGTARRPALSRRALQGPDVRGEDPVRAPSHPLSR